MNLFIHRLSVTLLILFSFSFFSCEYESVEASPECDANELVLAIDSTSSTLLIECGTSDGEIVLNLVDSLRDQLLFSLDEGEFKKGINFSSLGAGSYSIIAKKDGSECFSDPLSVEIENENGINLSIENTQNTNCGDANGSISVSQQNGVGAVEFKIGNGNFQSENNFDGLDAGTYSITARDANGCESTISNIKITTGVSLSQDIVSIINTNCAVTGCHNGSQPPNLSNSNNIISSASRIRSRTSSGTMPPSGREDLSQQQIDLISCWVQDGALNN